MSASAARCTPGDAGRLVQRPNRSPLKWLGRRSAMVALLVLLGTAMFAADAAADGTDGQQPPRMHFGARVAITSVCFSVTNPAGGQSTLYGLRYIDRGARVDSSTPAIVLVHGIASSTENWDF